MLYQKAPVKKVVDVYRSRIVIVHESELSDYNCIVQMYNIIKLHKMTSMYHFGNQCICIYN